MSILLTYPLDTIKTRRQLKKRVEEGGAAAGVNKDLFKGWFVRILVAVPSQAVFFVTHDAVIAAANAEANLRLLELGASLVSEIHT